MTMRYVHPAAGQKPASIDKFEKFRAEEIVVAATAQQIQGVTTRVATMGQTN